MRTRSVKRAKQERLYSKIRKAFLEENPVCHVECCESDSIEVHHMKGRIGALLTDVTYFLAVCRAHHNLIESHPAEAKKRGYSLSRLSKEPII